MNSFSGFSIFKEINKTDFSELIDSMVKLIIDNQVLMAPLKMLYRSIFNKTKVIMRISDVQCSKGMAYKPRVLNKFFISPDSKKLMYASVEETQTDVKNVKRSNIAPHYRLATFDFMDHIYGPNDSDTMMTDKINRGFLNLLKSYDDNKYDQDLALSTVYFTYGFSGSGKTYNTNNIISSLIEFIMKNYETAISGASLNNIFIKYGEIGALTTDPKDLLMSGKSFVGSSIDHDEWGIHSDDDFYGRENELLMPYYYETSLKKGNLWSTLY